MVWGGPVASKKPIIGTGQQACRVPARGLARGGFPARGSQDAGVWGTAAKRAARSGSPRGEFWGGGDARPAATGFLGTGTRDDAGGQIPWKHGPRDRQLRQAPAATVDLNSCIFWGEPR